MCCCLNLSSDNRTLIVAKSIDDCIRSATEAGSSGGTRNQVVSTDRMMTDLPGYKHISISRHAAAV